MRERIRSRAWATVRSGGFSLLPIVPVTVFELGPAALTVGHDILVEAGRDHLVRHGTGDPELGQGLDLVGHHLVASGLDRGNHVIDGGAGLGGAAGAVFGGRLRRDLGLRLLRGLQLSVFGLFGHGIFTFPLGCAQADTLRVAVPRLAFTRSMVNRNVSLARAVSWPRTYSSRIRCQRFINS